MADGGDNAEFGTFIAQTSKQLDDGAVKEALESSRAATERWPDAFWSHHLLGLSLEAAGHPQEAVAALRRALDGHPEHPQVPQARAAMARIQAGARGHGGGRRAARRPARRGRAAAGGHTPRTQTLYVATTRAAESGEYEIRRRLSDSPAGERPVPPPEVMEYGETPEFHLQSGREHVREMISALRSSGFRWGSCDSVLEFGCSNGRMTRWLIDRAAEREVWGVDIQADQVLWASEHLSPPLHFATTTTAPQLPFPDRHFDLIFAGSVFTHLGELHVSWLLELSRILSPRGFMYLTFHDETFANVVLPDTTDRFTRIADRIRESGFAAELESGDFDFVSTSPYGEAMLSQVMMSESYIEHVTEPFLRHVGTFPKAYAEAQTGYVFRPARVRRRPRAGAGGRR